MKKFTGNFTPNAGKVLKNSERIICRADEDGTIYITNGYFAFKLSAYEYAAVIQPAVCCEAGNWTMNNGEKAEEPPAFDLAKTFQDAEHKAAGMEALERCPLNLDAGKKRTAAAFYNAARGFAALYNVQYLEALAPGYTLRSPGSHAPAIAYQNGEPFAMILPIRIDDNISRAVKAYFTQAAEAETDEAEQLRAEIARLQDKLNQSEASAAALAERVQQQANEAEQLNAKISTLEEELSTVEHENAQLCERAAAAIADTVAPSPKTAAPAAEPKTAAELIASRWSNVDGVTVTIKGAQTTSPVVWLTGDTDPHADEIKAQGGKWSNKRGAYYVRVA